LRSLQEIQLDFEEDDKAYAGLWSQEKKKKKKKKKNENFTELHIFKKERTSATLSNIPREYRDPLKIHKKKMEILKIR
jgi:hypothetical protein